MEPPSVRQDSTGFSSRSWAGMQRRGRAVDTVAGCMAVRPSRGDIECKYGSALRHRLAVEIRATTAPSWTLRRWWRPSRGAPNQGSCEASLPPPEPTACQPMQCLVDSVAVPAHVVPAHAVASRYPAPPARPRRSRPRASGGRPASEPAPDSRPRALGSASELGGGAPGVAVLPARAGAADGGPQRRCGTRSSPRLSRGRPCARHRGIVVPPCHDAPARRPLTSEPPSSARHGKESANPP